MAAATRFELVSSRLQDERSRIPLSYAAKRLLVEPERIELSFNSLQGSCFARLSYGPEIKLVAEAGIEPATFRL